ncbi:MAG: hypothetical protein PWQ96_96 [Clostridia bacterium]|jgi:hypothetical protein|nr:hypothetical protein [Clostridiales bacterium]MDK2984454.1 hypothetical protein [Clostridia bacterium]
MAEKKQEPLLQTYPVPKAEWEERTMSAKAYLFLIFLAAFSVWITTYFM